MSLRFGGRHVGRGLGLVHQPDRFLIDRLDPLYADLTGLKCGHDYLFSELLCGLFQQVAKPEDSNRGPDLNGIGKDSAAAGELRVVTSQGTQLAGATPGIG